MSCYGIVPSGMSPPALSTEERKNICKTCYNWFIKAGWSDAFAMGVLANIQAESSFDYKVLTWDGNSDGHGIGGGLISFYYNGELPGLAKFCDGGSTKKVDDMNVEIKRSGILPYPNVALSSKNQEVLKKNGYIFPYNLGQQLNFLIKRAKEENAPIKDGNPSECCKWWLNKIEKPKERPDRWKRWGNTILKNLGKK